MKRAPTRKVALPAPRQIARNPEVAILHALELHCELTQRTLVAAQPVLEGHEIPYWARQHANGEDEARDILDFSIKLQAAIEAYFRVLENKHQAEFSDFDDDLPF